MFSLEKVLTMKYKLVQTEAEKIFLQKKTSVMILNQIKELLSDNNQL